MGWFREQISQRRLSDQKIMQESLDRIASAVLGKPPAWKSGDERVITKAAIDDILRYYHLPPAELPEDIDDLEERLELSLHPHGIMWRKVELKKGWYRDAAGPMLALRKEDGAAVALLPKNFTGYYYRDPEDGSKDRLTAATAELFLEEGFCFYRPLPPERLDIRDLIVYIRSCLSTDDFIILLITTLAATVLGMLMTNITRALTGFVLESGNIRLLMGTAVFMVSALLSGQLISTARQLMMSRIGIKASFALESAMMMRIMSLPAGFFRNCSSGELAERYNAVTGLSDLILGSILSAGLGAVISLLYITQMFHYAPALAGPAFLVILTGLVLSMLAGFMQIRFSRGILEKRSKESGLSFALISGIEKIRLSGAEKRAFARWAHAYAEETALRYNPPMPVRAGTAISLAVSLAGTVMLFWLAVKNSVTPSEYIAFSAAYGAVTSSFAALGGVLLSLSGVRPILETAKPILDAEPETSEARAMVTKLGGEIELANVSFRYGPSLPWVIRDLDLTIHTGEYVGIVGTTGCGKSTLVRLLLGFETPEIGAVYYDGRDLNGLDLHSLRRRIGTVTQDGRLFQGDIFSNIAVSMPLMSMEDAWEAAELAGIADDIRAMPMGMQTQISEGQGGISGGQKQRIMIARAVATKPEILIFDEATSALDNRTQQQISTALDSLRCTRIVIAHRLSTIRNCSRILVLDQGRIVEEGTYEELLQTNGLFAELVARQRLDI